MVTRFKVKIVKANTKYKFHVTTSSPIPKSLFHALRDPNWNKLCMTNIKLLLTITLGKADSPLFIFHKGPETTYLLLYVDGIILTASFTSLLQRIISLLHAEFAMTDLGPLNYFLGISAMRTTTGIFLSQKKYAIENLEQAHMLNRNPCRTLIDTEKKLGPKGSPVTDPTLYPHLNAMKRVLRYLRGITDLELQLFRSTTSQLIAYSDADWAGCPATRRSTSGYCVFVGDNLLTWSSKRQDTLSLSSVEAEFRGVANAVAETSWICNLLRELHTPLFTATLVYCDNENKIGATVKAFKLCYGTQPDTLFEYLFLER
nr:hypothetical protein [Tanacetum cinerariifolium]